MTASPGPPDDTLPRAERRASVRWTRVALVVTLALGVLVPVGYGYWERWTMMRKTHELLARARAGEVRELTAEIVKGWGISDWDGEGRAFAERAVRRLSRRLQESDGRFEVRGVVYELTGGWWWPDAWVLVQMDIDREQYDPGSLETLYFFRRPELSLRPPDPIPFGGTLLDGSAPDTGERSRDGE